MTVIRLTDPNSYVQVAFYAFGTYEEVAKATGTSVATVKQWRAVDRIPNKHLPVIAAKARINPATLFLYCKGRELVKPRDKPTDVIGALTSGAPHSALDDTRRKQLLTVWGDRLQTLMEVFTNLTQPFPDQESYGNAVRASAEALGVKTAQIYRLMRTFRVTRLPFKATKERDNQAIEAKKHKKMCENAAIDAIKGVKSTVKLAKDIGISSRQLFRYIEDALRPYPGITLQTLTRTHKYFRLAVANEIVNNVAVSSAMKIRAIYDKYPRNNTYTSPVNLKRASYKDKLIAVLTAEIGLNELAQLADTPIDKIEEAFETYCAPQGISWKTLRGLSLYHQAFFAETLKGTVNEL